MVNSQTATNECPKLLGLDDPRVWDTELAFEHLQALGEADSKRTAERRLHSLGMLPQEQTSDKLLDESEHSPNRRVLDWAIEQARKRRDRVMFVQLQPLPGGQPCLHANDARGARFWIPMARLDGDAVRQAIEDLQHHIGKPIAVFPHGRLVGYMRSMPGTADIHLCPQAYRPVLPSGLTLSGNNRRGQSLSLHLKRLEEQSIHLIREAVAEAHKPVMMYSIGKDSSVMLHLARKAFYPAPPPFPLLHIDTRWNFQEMVLFRDFMARESGMDLLVHTNPEAIEKNINPFDHGAALHNDIAKTEALKQALDHYQFDVVFGGTRSDEEKSRASEGLFSFLNATQACNTEDQRAELSNLYNTRQRPGARRRVLPLSDWTELDIWHYICQENIPVVPLYFAKPRAVVVRPGMTMMVDDERCRLLPGEEVKIKKVRFRSLGCYPLTGAVESEAETREDILQEIINARQGRKPAHKDLTVNEWMARQARQDLLRLITCGNVDDGESTLIDRLLCESQQAFDGLVSNLPAAEGDRFFSTPRRNFIVAEAPGHEQYNHRLITSASTADVAVLLVDPRQGVSMQTCRHAYLVSLAGVRQVVLAIDKMDLVGYERTVFDAIVAEFSDMAKSLGFEGIAPIPLSALKGDNISARSAHTPWYKGPTLMACLESIDLQRAPRQKAVFPVQWVNRPNASFRGLSGTLASGQLAVGDTLRVTASGQTATLARIVTADGDLKLAHAGDAVTLVLDREVDASRGDVISLADQPLEMTDQFESTLVWIHDEPGHTGRSYEMKLANQWVGAGITSLKYRVNPATQAHESCKQLTRNDIAVANLALSKPLVFEPYTDNPTLGSFILVDKLTRVTVAAGMIRHNLRRAQNVHRQALSIAREDRERVNGHQGKVIWFTGLSGSGKSTIANALEKELHAQGKRTYILDGDNVRQGLNKDLGFTDADRVENIRRVAEVAKLMMDAGLIVMTAFISPFRSERAMARELIGAENFIEVFVDTPLAVCEQRDPKGLYKKARSGQLPNMTGINSPYERPEKPDVIFEQGGMTIQDLIKLLL